MYRCSVQTLTLDFDLTLLNVQAACSMHGANCQLLLTSVDLV